MYIDREQRPSVISPTTCMVAALLHLAFFAVLWFCGQLDLTEKLDVIPIDLEFVAVENLDGVPDEPPPEPEAEPPKPPEPEPPPPEPPKPPEPPPEPPKPKNEDVVVPEPVKTNVVKAVEKPKEPEKPKDPPKPKETREDRIARMVASAKPVEAPKPPPKPRTNGRTDRKVLSDAEIARLMAAGLKPGSRNVLSDDERTMCFALIKKAFYDRWEDRPAWKASLRDAVLRVNLAQDGTVTGYRIVTSSTDSQVDASVLRAAAAVGRVPGLSYDFWKDNKTVDVQFHVKPTY